MMELLKSGIQYVFLRKISRQVQLAITPLICRNNNLPTRVDLGSLGPFALFSDAVVHDSILPNQGSVTPLLETAESSPTFSNAGTAFKVIFRIQWGRPTACLLIHLTSRPELRKKTSTQPCAPYNSRSHLRVRLPCKSRVSYHDVYNIRVYNICDEASGQYSTTAKRATYHRNPVSSGSFSTLAVPSSVSPIPYTASTRLLRNNSASDKPLGRVLSATAGLADRFLNC
jgi:hypothetical protein